VDPGEKNTLSKVGKAFKIYRVRNRSMVKARREYLKWDAFISAGNTGTLTISPMGKGKEKSTESTKNSKSSI
jgi:hypothetical protein